MRSPRLLWQFYLSFLVITILSLFAVAWYSVHAIRVLYLEQAKSHLVADATLLEELVRDDVERGDWQDLNENVQKWGAHIGTRVTVVLPSGKVVADSEESPANMGDHAGRPEIRGALEGVTTTDRRVSPTLKSDMVYAAVPVRVEGATVAVVRTALPITAVQEAVRAIHGQLAWGLIGVIVLTAIVSLIVTRRLGRTIGDLRRGAQRFAGGDLDHKLPVPSMPEFSALAEAMNEMASELNDRISVISRQRNELEAVLSSMEEGVIAVDDQERVISLNGAAARLLEIEPLSGHGRLLQEVVRNTDLQRFTQQTLSSQIPVVGEVDLLGDTDRHVHAHGTTLRDAAGKVIGALVVLHDVTQLRHLEKIRRDFVANVSHELKTPITSIKGFVETLQDGAIDSKEDAERFLGIIANQADRLNAIIEDLLSLSRIEQENEQSGIQFRSHPVHDVLRSAREACQVSAQGKGITLDCHCSEELTGTINAPLLEQAVVNLIDNAVKYSESGTTVHVDAYREEDEIVIAVRDEGCGIERRHLGRIFERFYRVDKARSSKMGGTGLGLSIVKHIAQSHGGYITVDSQPGTGSTFMLHLPQE